MRIAITARHLKLTPAIRTYVEEKFQKAQRYFNHIVWTQVVLSVEKRNHEAEVVVHASRQTFRALGKGADLYAAIDLASDKIDSQLKKYKERLKDRHRAEEPEIVSALPAEAAGSIRFSVIKQVPMRPMTREEAAAQMDALGYTFWMFQDQGSKHVQVIFRRLDDSYGLLQPVKWNGK
ncbi:MAG: ribosome-associated translation inhibitor RaiA [Elusimicrobia bacterium]|nr:ribosome-associated translation inhibitor RaiA [Elusimicrobiota bacterium]